MFLFYTGSKSLIFFLRFPAGCFQARFWYIGDQKYNGKQSLGESSRSRRF